MLSSIPLIAPRDAHTLWYTPTSTFSFTPFSSSSTTPQSLSSPPISQNTHPSSLPNLQSHPSRFRTPSISPLTQLALDEESVYQRKVNIQRFGATWIKPPGILKTYQVELDEEKERREAERQAMMEDVEVTGEDGVFDETAGEIAVEGDEDAEVPEAETETLWDDSDEEDEDEEDYEDEDEGEEEEGTHGVDSSPHQAIYSHDEHFGPPDSRVEQRLRQYPRRSLVRSDDGMEMDSD
ncbi:hypothetical protein B9Z19DRAFT_1106720 [Tuber borchii]|uniref:Apc15p protein-domain-containing protein n=1 Tax=Tuber borchii TaxID=42251 RepID=A0A2T6ZZN3_TUBBO|nr:hypothetical protein B9Z19DRAFT_1106720 [Tuber borchii]